MAYWLFQANLHYSQILTSLREQSVLYWLVTRYTDEIRVGDQVLVAFSQSPDHKLLAMMLSSRGTSGRGGWSSNWDAPMAKTWAPFRDAGRKSNRLLRCYVSHPILQSCMNRDRVEVFHAAYRRDRLC